MIKSLLSTSHVYLIVQKTIIKLLNFLLFKWWLQLIGLVISAPSQWSCLSWWQFQKQGLASEHLYLVDCNFKPEIEWLIIDQVTHLSLISSTITISDYHTPPYNRWLLLHHILIRQKHQLKALFSQMFSVLLFAKVIWPYILLILKKGMCFIKP